MSVGREQCDGQRVAGKQIGLQGGPIDKIAAPLNDVTLAGHTVEPKAERSGGGHGRIAQTGRSAIWDDKKRDALRRQRVAEDVAGKRNVAQVSDGIGRGQAPDLCGAERQKVRERDIHGRVAR